MLESNEIKEIFKNFEGGLSEKEAISQGLQIYSPKLSAKADLTFHNLSDKEIVSYVMCIVMGWQPSRLTKSIKKTNWRSISQASYRAIKKLKKDY
jgi:hypothetical protein